MPYVRFEPKIPASERAKTVHALDRSAAVTDYISFYKVKNRKSYLSVCEPVSVLKTSDGRYVECEITIAVNMQSNYRVILNHCRGFCDL
jgi:hypothetical protein